MAEAPEPPEGVQWLALHYDRAVAQLARAAAARGGAPPPLPALQEAAVEEAAAELAGDESTPDASPTDVRVVVSLARAELELHQLLEGVSDPQPLARFSIEDLGLAFHNTEEVRGVARGMQFCSVFWEKWGGVRGCKGPQGAYAATCVDLARRLQSAVGTEARRAVHLPYHEGCEPSVPTTAPPAHRSNHYL